MNSLLKFILITSYTLTPQFGEALTCEEGQFKLEYWIGDEKNEHCHDREVKWLILSEKGITRISPSIGELVELEYVDLESNELEKLPESMGNLVNLRALYLRTNKLRELPEWIGNLKKLEHLHIADNQISELPSSLGQLNNLTELELNRNPLNSPSSAFWKKLGYVPAMLGIGYFQSNHLDELQEYLRRSDQRK